MASMTELITPKRQAETHSAVERIGAFAVAARPEHLTTDSRQLFKRNILDSIGCAIAAVAGPSLRTLRDQIEEYRAPGRCTLIGGGKTTPDQAALFSSSLVRYVDLLDSYIAQGGLCHPSDNFGTILAAAEYLEASGEEFMLALAVAYEIQCRFTARVPVMAKGFNRALQLAISAAAGAGKLFALSADELANAIAIATVDNISLACVHAEPVSQWKGFSPGITGMRAVYAASLAKRGFTGPKGLFEGPYGLEQMFAQSIPVDWEDPSLDIVKQTIMKKYCSLIHGQPVLEAVLDLKRSNSLTANDVEHVLCEVFKPAFDFAGGGSFGPKDHPKIKEQGDYNLKYLVAAALLDDQVGPAQLEERRIQAPDAQALLTRVEVRPDERFSARYPRELSAAITIRTQDGRVLVKEQHGYEGGLNKPMSWDRTVEKFHWLSETFADEDLRNRLIRVVQQLDARPISDLTELLAQGRELLSAPLSQRMMRMFGSLNDLKPSGMKPTSTGMQMPWRACGQMIWKLPFPKCPCSQNPTLSNLPVLVSRMKFLSYRTSDIHVRVYGDAAVVTGRLQRTRSMNGQEISDDWRFTKTYIRESQKWRVVAFHASEIAQP